MSVTGCRWPGCEEHGRRWCEKHYRALPHHLRVRIAQGDDPEFIDAEALSWIRVTYGGDDRERSHRNWETLVRFVRERDAARARRRAATGNTT